MGLRQAMGSVNMRWGMLIGGQVRSDRTGVRVKGVKWSDEGWILVRGKLGLVPGRPCMHGPGGSGR
jgi:hypothetical protein